ncbi:MAG: fibronectin type III domain-containing protein, partial [Acidobacteriota bacterium]|nr:fibronectin type III domain-containing protein [Acidobacteriota bacterium]
RHNPDAPGGDLVVTETYEYRDPAGRLSSKKTSLSSGETFTDSYSYNKLGAPLTLTYPACVGCSSLTQPPRTITNTYSNGMLTGVSGYASLSYHANGMVNTVAHTNVGGGTVVDRYTVDTTTALARPESITFENFCNDLSAAPLVSKTVASGSPAGLTVSASGATTYQWYERANGTDSAIAGQTSSTLSTTVSSTRQFWVRVGNGTCTVDSTVATVTPTVCAQPPATITAPSTVARAAAASASVAATAGATYAWTISQGGTITSGASTNAITFMVDCATPSVTLSVTVTASCGSTSTASKAVSSGAAVTAALTTSTPVIAQGSSATIHVDLTGTANWTLSWSPSAPSCGAVGASFDCTVSPAGTRSYTLTATDANGCSASSAPLQITVTPPAPQSLTATATSSTSVQLTWTYSGTAADSYEVQRQAAGGGFVADGPAVTTTSIVRAAAANGAYLYRVRAVKGGTPSAWSVVDLATTVIFDDDPLQQFQTVIFAQHVLQLRTAVNAVRALSGSAAFAFTDSSLAGLSPKPAHVQELRDALNQARQVLGLSTVSFAEPVLSSGTPFRASHLMEVRGGVR